MGYNAGTMMNNFERILRLVQRTGDRVVVLEKETDQAYVVMDLDEYETMLDVQHDLSIVDDQEMVNASDESGLLQEEVLNTGELDGGDSEGVDVWDVMQGANDSGQTWDPTSLSEEELVDLEQQYQAFANRHVQEAIDEVQVPQGLSPNLEASTDEDEYGEESFYLEPVE